MTTATANPDTITAAAAGELWLGGETPVRRMGYGTMQLPGLPIAWGPPRDHEEAISVLRRAVELGVQLIDTAGFYGPAITDELIAEALHPYPGDVVISTKVGVRRGGDRSWIPDAAPASLREQVEASLRRLRIETVDLVHLRLADPVALDDSRVPLSESFGALAELQAEGLVRHLGLSSATEEQLAEARTIAPVDAVQNHFNVADRSGAPTLRRCEREGIAFIPYFPLARGELTRSDELARIARRHDATAAQVALAWLLRHSPATLLIPGTSSVAHLEQNLAAASLRLDADDMSAIM
jgi:aryl-alcohol dehydrogenase-like predicted oxidoreductase